MPLTLLLDLDDTLLVNPMDTFLPAYLEALSDHLSEYGNPPQIITTLLAATKQMTGNQLAGRTLKTSFDQAFYPALNWQEEEMRPVIEAFYRERFPQLSEFTRPNVGAKELLGIARERGYTVAITTNPLFPATAILQRLNWAGWTPDDPLMLVSSYESFHFAKPDPAFYAECMARLGWPEGPVLVAGDDPLNDIQAATLAGLPTYQVIHNPGGTSSTAEVSPTGSGPLANLTSWLEVQPEELLIPELDTPPAMVACLRATPAALDSLCYKLDLQNWNRRPMPGEWCQTEILCHLRDVDQDVNLPRIEKILAENNPFIPGEDTHPWSETRGYIHQDGPEALKSLISIRTRLLDLLLPLTPEDWYRTARHAIFGPTTLREIISIICAHDRLHLRQIKKVIQTLEPH